MAAVPTPGENFNQQFDLLEVLGSGGVSTVFKAKQMATERLEALKFFYTVENDNDKFKERCLSAAKALSDYSGSGIARVIEYGESSSGTAFVASELIEGTSLRKLLKTDERLPCLVALKVGIRAAEILTGLHASGFVHRDLKTDNLILTEKSDPASLHLVDPAFTYLEETEHFARAGTLIGSPRYISPEQGGGKPSDFRADIYSLTVCLYEMLVGEKPYEASTSALVLYKHLNDPVPQIRADQVDRFLPQLNEVIAKGMAKEPSHRFQSMKEFADALNSLHASLEKVAASEVVKREVVAESKGKSSPIPIITGALLVMVLIFGGVALFLHPRQSKKTEAEFDSYQNQRKKKTIAFLESDLKRLERKLAAHKNDSDALRNLASRMRSLAEAQRGLGDLKSADKTANDALKLFAENSSSFREPDFGIKLQGELALIQAQEHNYEAARATLKIAQDQVDKLSPPEADGSPRKMEACLLPARIELNILLHNFDLAGKDISAAFALGHLQDKDLSDAPPAVATAKSAWETLSDEPLKDANEKLAALSLINLLITNLLDADKDLCKAPAQRAQSLLTEIPPNTAGYAGVVENTKSVLTKYESAARRKS